MDSAINENNYKFPKVVFIIISNLASLRTAHSCITSVLALYMVDILHVEESQSVIVVHMFMLSLLAFSLLGGILSDSRLGRFTSTLCFNFILIVGLTLLAVSSITPLHLPIRELTLVSIFLESLGYGASRPSTVTFAGDQFVLPQQTKKLSLLFSLIFIGNNIGSLCAYFIAPILRKDVVCFQELTCYPLVFSFALILVTVSIVTVLLTKRFYIIKKSEGNMALDVVKCVSYAVYKKFKLREKHVHWLDCASDKYNVKLIEDIKSVLHVLKLFLPMPIYWALLHMELSTWTFQASRMDGEFKGYLIKPDQIQVFESVFMVTCAAMFHNFVYSLLEKYLFLRTPLRKITVACLLMTLAYVCSGVLELNLEPTYAVTPTTGSAQLRIFNTLNCNVSIAVDEQKIVLEQLSVWENVSIPANGQKFLKYNLDFHDCEMIDFHSKQSQGEIEVKESQATSWVLTNNGLNYNFIDAVDKSTSGNALVRALVYVDKDFPKETSLKLVHDGEVLTTVAVSKNFKESERLAVNHNKYDLYLNDQLVQRDCPIRVGGVYAIVGHVSSTAIEARVVTVTKPNSVHIFWILPQVFLLAAAEAMMDVLMTGFAFSQAPPNMKTLLQSCWLCTGAFGNLIVIVITQLKPVKRRAYEFFLYAVLMVVGTVVFVTIASFYKYKDYSNAKKDEEKEQNIFEE